MGILRKTVFGMRRGYNLNSAYISTWNTENTDANSTPNNQIQLNTSSTSTYNFTVNWGDGTEDIITAHDQQELLHTYSNPGIYTITILGTCPFIYSINDSIKLISVDQYGEIDRRTSQNSVFAYTTFLTTFTHDGDMNEVISGDAMFRNTGLTSLPPTWRFDNLTDGDNMFIGLKADLPEGITFSSLTTSISMFNGATFSSLPSTLEGNNIITGGNMFRGCSNLTSLPDNFLLDSLENGGYMFFQTSLTTLPPNMTLNNLISSEVMFQNCPITTLPTNMALSSLVNGKQMFLGGSLTSLPEVMTLDNLVNGRNMFNGCDIAALPTNMTLPNLTDGRAMFAGNLFTEFPVGMTLPNLINADSMFMACKFTSIPSGFTFDSVTSSNSMFENSLLETLPEGVTFENTTNTHTMFQNSNIVSLPSTVTFNKSTICEGMFQFSNITEIPSSVSFSAMTNGNLMFNGCTLTTQSYSDLLVRMEANNPNNDVVFHGGDSMYNEAGEIARDALIVRGWTFTDGGREPLPALIQVDTTFTGSTASDTFSLYSILAPGWDANFIVDWGDGTNNVITDRVSQETELIHTYATGGVKNITITGEDFYIRANGGDNKKLKRIDQCGLMKPNLDYGFWFTNCTNLEYIHNDFNTTGATNMERAFESCTNLISIPLFDTSLVTEWTKAFYLNRFTSIPEFDTSSAQNYTQCWRNDNQALLDPFPIISFANINNTSGGYLIFHNAKITTSVYSQILIKAATEATFTGVTLDVPLVKYENSAVTARDYLVNSLGWIINDAGLLAVNLEIGNMSSVIPDKSTLASKLGLVESDIQYFNIVGTDIEATVNSDYDLVTSYVGIFVNTPITYFRDLESRLQTRIEHNTFRDCPNLTEFYSEGDFWISAECFRNSPNLSSFYAPNANRVDNLAFRDNSSLTTLDLPGVTIVSNTTSGTSGAFRRMLNTDVINIPSCTSLGANSGYTGTFYECKQGLTVNANTALQTNNGGSMDGDLQYVIDTLNGTVNFV
jgi:hypothetical protein